MQAAGISHIGLVREKNEDKYIMDLQQKLFVICDGMGGHKGGKIASAMAAQVIERQYTSNDEQDRAAALNAAINAANQKIWQVGSDNPEYQEMGTTATAAVIAGERLIVAHVGDSSLFLLRDGQICKITTDHTLARQMVMDGLLDEDEVRTCSYNHILTRAVGVQENIEIDNYTEIIQPGDQIILCSDGLTDMLAEEEMLEIMNENKAAADPEQLARALVDAALNKGGYDNITIIVLVI
ncbi:MAG: Stp1/IreP family PP2C-type Ser/Thr phosphatase [Syntrophomonadaceae bacterium]|jgi:protein phosphatase|nr:Stp1/IreP family PP2C-type Ser/Thr phosphatase [Syntrophomonadaceae bacterium]